MKRSQAAEALAKRTGSYAGDHKIKTLRGSGKGKGKQFRHPKHKKATTFTND